MRARIRILLRAEYAILSIAAFSTAVHLVLHVIDSRMEGAWHGKATWTMLLEFFSEVKPCNPNFFPLLLLPCSAWEGFWCLFRTPSPVPGSKR